MLTSDRQISMLDKGLPPKYTLRSVDAKDMPLISLIPFDSRFLYGFKVNVSLSLNNDELRR